MMKMKAEKGMPGYLDYQKKVEIIKTIVCFAIIAAIFLLGYMQTHTRNNVLTIVAILGCLPACKVLVGVITRIPYHSTKVEIVNDVQEKAPLLTKVYDLVVTSTEKIMPIECIVISGDKVFGYVSDSKVDLSIAAKHIQSILQQNQYQVSVKLFDQYKAFLARAEGLNNIAEVEHTDLQEQEDMIRRVILAISL